MKTVVLTGSAGFVGAHVVEHLLVHTDWRIIGLDSFRHRGDSLRVYHDPKRYIVYTHDLTNPISDRLIKKIGPVDYIINMASDSHVDRSITDPVPFCENNVKLVLTMLEYARKVKPEMFIQISTDEVYGPALNHVLHKEWSTILPSNPYSASKASQENLCISFWRSYNVPVVLTNCFSMDTHIMTENGIKSYNDIQIGDKVFTLDENENLILTPILKKVIMDAPNNMIYFNSNQINQLVTPNHRMMIKKCHGKPRRWGNLEVQYAENLINLKGRIQIPLTGKWVGKNNLSKKFKLPNICISDEDMCAIYGWYVSEGYTTQDKRSKHKTVCFGAGSKRQQDEIKLLLKPIGDAFVNGRSVKISNNQLFFIVQNFGKYAINKYIPKEIKNLNVNLLKCFFDSAIKGDGSIINNNIVYYTKSWQLANDMAEIGMKLGYGIRISERYTWNPEKTKKSMSYIVRFKNNSANIEKQYISNISNYKGKVWCVQTKTGKVFVFRKGVISLSGQTMNIFGERQDREKFIPMTIAKICKGEIVTIHGSENNIGSRFYLHARNQSDALLFIMRNVKPTMYYDNINEIIKPDRFNIVGDIELNNLELAQMIADILRKPLHYKLEDFHHTRPGHDRRYALDGSKLKNLGWIAPVSFHKSLEKTVLWTVEHPEWMV